jgi:hypothetical protein
MAPDPAYVQRILDLAHDLHTHRDALTLDTIDGEFFWRGGHAPIAQSFETHATPPLPQPDHTSDLVPQLAAFMRALRAQRDAWSAIEAEHPDNLLYVPWPVQDCLFEGRRVPMRPASITTTIALDQFPDARVLRIQVRSGEWRGQDVEDAIASYLQHDPLARDVVAPQATPSSGSGEPAAMLQVAFQPHGDLSYAEEENWVFSGPAEYPYLQIVVPLPLPPLAAIARQYDYLVREHHRWHERLPGGIPNGQHKGVAIRTWAIGLLQATGMTFHRALWLVLEATGGEGCGQGRYNQDRQLLLKRVPEARPFVYAVRPKAAEPETA